MVKGLLRRAPQAAGGGLGAVSASQFPAFYGQYLQSLGGRLDQAREQAARLDAMAAEIGLSASAYAQRLSASADEAVQRAGLLDQGLLDDRARLQAAYDALAGAAIWQRPYRLAVWGEGPVASATLQRFQPSLAITAEGFAYAAVGLLLGLGLIAMTRRALGAGKRSGKKEETT